MKLTLPYPVSANRYWRSFVPKGWTRAVVHPSDEAKAYKREVGWIAKEAGFRKPTDRPIRLVLTLVPKNGVVMDLGNCLKVAEDALQGIVYENDKQVRAISLAYGEPDGKGALVVEITEFEPELPPLFAPQVSAKETA
jgi:crossover junction endodeoxyribonuclease RusA